MLKLRVSPFVPGAVRGTLRHHRCTSETDILLLSYQELEAITTRPAGLIIIGGAPLAHPMIRLYSYGIPTVVVSRTQAARLPEGVEVHLDAYNGWISELADEQSAETPARTQNKAGKPVPTADGIAIELRASVASAEGVANAVANGATAIGMVRSEFLLPADGRQPDEEFYFTALRELCERAEGLPLTVRLLDLAPDKHPSWLGPIPDMTGPLGLRGARLYQLEPVKSVFRAELKAIGRLAETYDLRLLLPYMTRPEEFTALQGDMRQALKRPIPIGVMVETPAAALALPEWLALVDFVVVGCNDLMQCLFAADRDVSSVAALLDPYAPVLHRFLHQMAQTANAHLHRIQLGGLLPQIPGLLPLLSGMGYRNFSVEPLLIPCMARLVTQTSTTATQQLVSKVCDAHTAAEVRELLGLPAEFSWGAAK